MREGRVKLSLKSKKEFFFLLFESSHEQRSSSISNRWDFSLSLSLTLSHFTRYVVNSHSLTPFFVEIFQSTDFRFVWFGICFLSARLELLLTIQNKRVIRLFRIELFRRIFLHSSPFSSHFFLLYTFFLFSTTRKKNFYFFEREFKLFKFQSFVSVLLNEKKTENERVNINMW